MEYKLLFNRLDNILKECDYDGWDGYNGDKVTKKVLEYTSEFIKTIPIEIENPEIVPESDGCIGLNWDANKYMNISISIGTDGFIYYASIIGENKIHGKYSIGIGITEDLLDIIKKVTKNK